ncbi:flagellar hook-associated protein FlgL [Idiomarina piscisalsi]|uniref:Flagellar hook-associated protein 3 n=1 Tax=Idiomarina piscisalsi TaxID=1096243 RepID=A0A432YHJ6_9GAMM|nr:flagellar hook-associated protein FlgL [Idiomarina piscisalsi]RUO60432.1 flagellar hook-associated protein 3 [Idiomarina piscisalsi]
MRLSTNLFFQRGLDSLQTSQSRLDKIQLMLTKQTKILSPADDPIGNSQVLALNEKIGQNEQFERNSVTLENNLRREESVLNSITDSIQKARTLAVQAGNASYDQTNRKAIASELRNIEASIFDLTNAQDESGEYIFAGYQNRIQPMEFNDANQAYEYVGDQGQRTIQLSPTLYLPANDPGSRAFSNVSKRVDFELTGGNNFIEKVEVTDRDALIADTEARIDAGDSTDFTVTFTGPNDYEISDGTNTVTGTVTDGKVEYNGMTLELNPDNMPTTGDSFSYSIGEPVSRNLLTQIRDLATALEESGPESKGFHESEIAFALDDFNTVISDLTDTQASVGARLNVMDNAKLSNADIEIVNKKARADISDVDYSEAVTDLVKNETIYSAAQQVFTRISRLSLFDYL